MKRAPSSTQQAIFSISSLVKTPLLGMIRDWVSPLISDADFLMFSNTLKLILPDPSWQVLIAQLFWIMGMISSLKEIPDEICTDTDLLQ